MNRQLILHRVATAILYALCLVGFAACNNELEYDPAGELKNQYTVGWVKKFGVMDQNQTWNMATPVKADIDPAAYGDGVWVYVYTANPTSGGKLLGKTSSRTTLTLDVMRDLDNVFVQVRDTEGHCYENSYYPIQNGTVSVCGHRSVSRAASDVSLGDTKVFAEGAGRQEEREAYNESNPYTLTEAIAKGDKYYLWKKNVTLVDANTHLYHVVFQDIYDNEYPTDFNYYFNINDVGDGHFKAYGGFTDEEIASIGGAVGNILNQRLIHPASHEVTYQKLNGVETTHDKTVMVKDLAPLFGKGSYFEEQRDPSCLEKWKDYFNPDVQFTVEGPLTLDFMYGATQNENIFGYYFWHDGEDPTEAVRYILIGNATPENNISINTADNYLSGGMELSGIMVNGNPEESEDMLIGTSYKVPYFDAEGNASYDFPKGTHVAFFLIVNGIGNEDVWLGNTNLSVQSHNYAIGRTFSGYSRDSDDSDATKGEIDAITFQYGSQFYLGFEDRGGDKDMNDIVFFVSGKVKPQEPYIQIQNGSEPIPVNPEDPVTPGTPETPTTPTVPSDSNSWVIACEDLGSTEDYDFNDIVFSVSHVAGETTAYITPLAAGGILSAEIYYNGAPINGTAENSEIHYLLSGRHYTGTCPMLNTTAGSRVVPGTTIEMSVGENFSIVSDLKNFSIKVSGRGDSYEVTVPDDGIAPQVLCLPADWRWPSERVDITEAYPDFKRWTMDMTALGWIKNVAPGSVISR